MVWVANLIGHGLGRVGDCLDPFDSSRRKSSSQRRTSRIGPGTGHVLGDPDSMFVLLASLFVFSVVLLALKSRPLGGPGFVQRPFFDLAIASVAGAMLAAPLLLPGIQLISKSVRSSSGSPQSVPASQIVHVLLRGYDGLPLSGDQYFGAAETPYPRRWPTWA